MSNDPQDQAETLDEDRTGQPDPVNSDEAGIDMPPDRPLGLPHADADVTDESLADRVLQEEPEVTPDDIDPADADRPIEEPVDLDDLPDDERPV